MPPRSCSQSAGPSESGRLSGEDALFVHAETPLMPMHSLGMLILDPVPSLVAASTALTSSAR